MLYTKNRLFAQNGHDCEITYNLEEFPMFIPGKTFKEKVCRAFVRMRMASEVNRRANYYLRSQGAITREHYIHLNYLHMIHPFSDIRTIWETFMIIVFLIQFITIPIDILTYTLSAMVAFQATVQWKIFRIVLNILCIFDVGMNFISGFYDHKRKEVVIEPWEVMRHYLYSYFLLDVLSSIPPHLDLIIPMSPESFFINFVLFSSVLKFVRVFSFKNYCKHFAETFKVDFMFYRIFMVIVFFLLVYHLMCCFFLYMFGKIFLQDENMIYTYHENRKSPVTSGYFHTLYQTTLIVCLSGYKKNLEHNALRIFVICSWITSNVIYIFLLARIMEVVMAKTSSSHKYVEMVRQLKEYMRHKQLPEYMQHRLILYYEFRFQKSFFRENEILNTVSGQLRQEITMHGCRKLVENVAFFKNLPINLLVRIVLCLKLEIFLVNDVIVRANTPGDSMYFISSGTVAIYTKSGKEIVHLEDGAHFGEIALVMKDELRVASVVAVDICELFRLDRKDFMRAVYPYPDLLNNVQHIAYDRMERTAILDEHNRREISKKLVDKKDKQTLQTITSM